MDKKVEGGILEIRVSKQGHCLIKALVSGQLSQKQDGTWTSYCKPLDLYTCGKTRKEALKNTGEAIEAFFESCVRRGTLEDALRELNWKKMIEMDADGLVRVTPQIHSSVPPAFVIDKVHQQRWQGHVVI
jgi:predicted RNase H-like HicB family nuclease